MNVTDLARQLKIHPQKLLQVLPEFGFDIGARAVKVDDRVANQIQKEWRRIKFVLEEREKKEKEKQKELEKEMRQQSDLVVKIPDKITVKELSVLLDLPLNKLIVELMKNGILVSQNENLDYDTAVIIAEDLGFKVDRAENKDEEKDSHHVTKLENILTQEATTPRAPVIVVMGHVDHGKTKLLDAVRHTNVIDTESGGITQHIGAYQVVWTDPKSKEKRPITFIDTPGHEAFTVMRSRGAKVADIAILVVAADDGVKPQTVEAINIIKAAKLPFIVAINKIDKEGADPQRVRTDLSQYSIIPEEWGGEVPMVEISAKQNLNIDKLLDTLLLLADINEGQIRANPHRSAAGTVIEAHVDKGEGPVATILVQTGMLINNDPLVVNGEIYGKVRAMKNYRGENILQAGPSTPVRILGFKVAPQVGDVLDVGSVNEAQLIDVKAKRVQQSGAEKVKISNDSANEEEGKKYFNVVIKADMLGSLEAIIGAFEKMKNEEVSVRVVGKGLGNITADDVTLAQTANAKLFAFHVTPMPLAAEMIRNTGIEFKEYKVIYDMLNYIEEELEKMLNPEVTIVELGIFKVMQIFRSDKNQQILGGRVEKGKIIKDAKVRIKRKGEHIGIGKLPQIQMGRQSVSEIMEGNECGAQYEGKLKVEEGDVFEVYKEESKKKKLEFN
ncbi:MAG TPA: translation initiation factor IF-2 [Candidatus Magasanikbacteria bacterium]|nr:translation initiation factor IF-2 [Candidatus Magasanikbacteria bacterium]